MIDRVRQKQISLMRNTVRVYKNIFDAISQQDATTYRDSGDGWTALEALCHVRDFDRIFRKRAERILNEDHPMLKPQDHVQLVIDGDYNNQNKDAVIASFLESREATAAFFEALSSEDWERAGTHPERDTPFTLTDAVVQVCSHDADHLEQITRILLEKRTS